MSFTYDTTTDLGRVRMKITDRDEAYPIFSDAEIEAFLAMEGSVNLASAAAMETIAANEALVQKRIKVLDLETDGASTAKALLDVAKRLREADSQGGAFAIVAMIDSHTAWEERMRKNAMRSGGIW